MITIYYVENNQQKKRTFDIPNDEYLAIMKLLKEYDYKWYTVDKGLSYYNPDQLTLDFGEIQ